MSDATRDGTTCSSQSDTRRRGDRPCRPRAASFLPPNRGGAPRHPYRGPLPPSVVPERRKRAHGLSLRCGRDCLRRMGHWLATRAIHAAFRLQFGISGALNALRGRRHARWERRRIAAYRLPPDGVTATNLWSPSARRNIPHTTAATTSPGGAFSSLTTAT